MKSGIERDIRSIVATHTQTFAKKFAERHIKQVDKPFGVINMKIHNVFIAFLGGDIQYYTALVRSLDSSLGNTLEKMAIEIAELFYVVKREVTGQLYNSQTALIAKLLEGYKNKDNALTPSIEHYQLVRDKKDNNRAQNKVHVSDYYLFDKKTDTHYLIELKIGGDLDNKKARSEKEAIFEQYAILANELGDNAKIKCFFATAYNRFGENKEWKQERVRQFFAEEELMIGKEFWNFVCQSEYGYEVVLGEYEKNAHFIKEALDEISQHYLKKDVS